MLEKNNHPTLEMIMDFASLSKDTIDRNRFGDYFAMVAHFVQCEKCRKIKDEMIMFLEQIDLHLSESKSERALKLKIYYSLELLELTDEWKNNEILLSVKGKISKQIGESVIQSIRFDREKEKNMQFDGDLLDKYSEVIDSNNNRISFGSEKIEVSLCDDGRDKHSVLIIPENVEKQPILCTMKKETDMWQVSCDCPEDDYDIVVF